MLRVPVSAKTLTGPVRGSPLPSPSWPCRLLPQQSAVPSVVTTQVETLPAVTSVAPVKPATATGDGCADGAASPSCPSALAPQQ